MNTSAIIRILGFIATLGAAVSYLFEGWNNFNDLSKYLLYLAFLGSIYLLSELKSFKDVSRLFLFLFIALVPSVFAQLGSFILDQQHQIPKQVLEFSPLRVGNLSHLRMVVVLTFLALCPLLMRVLKRFEAGSPVIGLAVTILSGLIFLVPLRTPEFHVLGGMGIGLLWLLNHNIQKFKPHGLILSAAMISPLIVFTGRACLYETNTLFYSYLFLFLAAIFILVIPDHVREKNDAAGFVFIGNFFVIFGSVGLAAYLSLTSIQSYILSSALITVFMLLNQTHKNISLGFFVFMGWYRLMIESFGDVSIATRLTSTLISILALGLSYKLRHKASFQASALLILLLIFKNVFEVIEFPQTNIWIILAATSVCLFVLSFLIDKFKQPVGAKIKEIMNELE